MGLVVLLFAPLLAGRSFWLRDTLEFTYPLKGYLLERMRAVPGVESVALARAVARAVIQILSDS